MTSVINSPRNPPAKRNAVCHNGCAPGRGCELLVAIGATKRSERTQFIEGSEVAHQAHTKLALASLEKANHFDGPLKPQSFGLQQF